MALGIFHRDGTPWESGSPLPEWDDSWVIARDKVGPATVSTVFTMVDYGFSFISGMGAPLLFETMVFGGPLDRETQRYASEEEARQGHEAMVVATREAIKRNQEALRSRKRRGNDGKTQR